MPLTEARKEQMRRLGVPVDLELGGPPDNRKSVKGVLVPPGRSEFGTAVGSIGNRTIKVR